MRRSLLLLSLIISVAGISIAVIREAPFLRGGSGLTGHETGINPVADSLRLSRLYTITLRSPVDSICVCKHLHELYVFRHGPSDSDTLLRIYRIALGDAPVGHKHSEGDERTPEGLYYIDGKNPASSCHKNLGVSYPNSLTGRMLKSTASHLAATLRFTACQTARDTLVRHMLRATGQTAA